MPCPGLTLSPSLTAVREASDEERSDGDQPADTAVPAAAESRQASGYALSCTFPHVFRFWLTLLRVFRSWLTVVHVCSDSRWVALHPFFACSEDHAHHSQSTYGPVARQVRAGAQPVAGTVDAGGHPGERAAALRLLRPVGQHQPGPILFSILYLTYKSKSCLFFVAKRGFVLL